MNSEKPAMNTPGQAQLNLMNALEEWKNAGAHVSTVTNAIWDLVTALQALPSSSDTRPLEK